MKTTLALASLALSLFATPAGAATTISIVGDEFHLNDKPTYAGRTWRGHKIQGLLMNARLVQGIFDDRNTNTVARWAYPDTGMARITAASSCKRSSCPK